MLSENGNGGGFFMPVAPAYNGGGGFGNGFGGDGWWILLLLLFAGGWGNNGFGGGMFGGNDIYPWMNQANLTSNGFQNQMLNDNINSIKDGITDISTQLCNGFAGIEQGANARQMADMNQMFGISQQLSQCCCDNRLATCQTQNIVQNEGSATRQAIQGQTQAILDKLCSLELDGYKRENDNLRSQLNMATLRESQTAQNAFIAQGLTNEVDALYNRLSNCPVPSVPVYGRQPIFTCNNNGCGCGCGA